MIKHCKTCGIEIVSISNRKEYCIECAKKKQRLNQLKYNNYESICEGWKDSTKCFTCPYPDCMLPATSDKKYHWRDEE